MAISRLESSFASTIFVANPKLSNRLINNFRSRKEKATAMFVVCSFTVFLFFLLLVVPPHDLDHVSKNERSKYLQQAAIWHRTNVSAMNVYLGPQNEISVPPEAEVPCTYLEKPPAGVGFTPKFKCSLQDSGEVVRIKFSRKETLAEVAGTRLMWALGFYTDEVYPVQLRCYGCPEKNPAKPGKDERRIERVIYDAMMERTFDGKEIVQYPDQGWSWRELEELKSQSAPEKKAQIDGLKLLSAFMQHTDSKRSQQRLACASANIIWTAGEPRCNNPLLMVQDLGETFGEGSELIDASSAMYYKGWNEAPVWNLKKEMEQPNRKTCFARLVSAGNDGLFDPAISEEGRAFLSKLLNELTDPQIRDLFRAARAGNAKEKILENGKLVSVTIEHWLSAFKRKRQEISAKRCN